MNQVLAAVLGAGFGIGLLLVMCGVGGRSVLPDKRPGSDLPGSLLRSGGRHGLVVAVGLVVLAVTRWPVGAVLAAGGLALAPRLLGGKRDRERAIGRTESIASWTELVRDSIVAASGLEEAIKATGAVAPAPIASEVQLLVRRLEYAALPQALVEFGRDLHHPCGDLVVTALVLTAELEARDLSGLLSRLAEATRGDARMRIRVEVGRSRVRTAAKVILGVVLATVCLLALTDRGYLAVYSSATGQAVLAAIGAIFALGGWLLAHMAAVEIPERFTARSRQQSVPSAR